MKTLKQLSLLAMAFFMANECFAMDEPVGHQKKQSQLREMANTMCDILEGIKKEFDGKEGAIEITINHEDSSNESQVEEGGDDSEEADSEDKINEESWSNEESWRLRESKQYKDDLKQAMMLIKDEQVNQKINNFLKLHSTSLINLKIEACRKQNQIRQPFPQTDVVIEEDESEKQIKYFQKAISRINNTIENISKSYEIAIYNLLTQYEINKTTPINRINELMRDNVSDTTTARSQAMQQQLKSMIELLIATLQQGDEEVIKYVFVNDEITKNLLFTDEIESLRTTIDNEARIKYRQQIIAQNQQRQPAIANNQQRQPARAASVSSGPNSFNNTGLAKRKASKKSQGRWKRAGRNQRNGKKKNRKRRGSRTRRK